MSGLKLRRCLVVVSVAIAGVAIADMPSGSAAPDMMVLKDQTASPGTVRVSKLFDVTVYDPSGKDIGHLTDVILTRDLSAVSYFALGQGVPNTIGRKVFAVPYAALKYGGPADLKLYTYISGDALAKAKGINEAMYPIRPDADLQQWVATNVMAPPAMAGAMEPKAPEAMMASAKIGEPIDAAWAERCTMLIGSDVISPDGIRLGSIKDVVINRGSGQVTYAVVAQQKPWGMEGDYYAVPLDAFRMQAQSRKLVLSLTPDELLRMPTFDKDHWPSIPDPKWTALSKGHMEPAMQ